MNEQLAPSNGHLTIPEVDHSNDIKCNWCSALNPRIGSRVLQIGPAMLAVLFSCGKCKHILSISAVPIEVERTGLIETPF